MGDTEAPRDETPEAPNEAGSLREFVERIRAWVDELLHPPVLVPVPVPARPSR